MNDRQRKLLACCGIAAIFLAVQIGALALVEPFQQEGHQVVKDTGNPTISILYVGAIIVVTGLMLVAMKYGGDDVLRLIIIFASAYISLFVFQVIVPNVVTVEVGGTSVDVIAWLGAAAVGAALYAYPEWYVVDAAGIVMGIGGAGLFGINFGILPALVLLTVLAVYDAISVYGTEHMLTLASGVMDMRVPVVLVVPLTFSYSFLDAENPVEEGETQDDPDGADDNDVNQPDAEELETLGPEGIADLDEERLMAIEDETVEELDDEIVEAVQDALPGRDALFIGLGDAVIPTVLVASAAFFVESGPTVSLLGVSANLPAVGAIAGTMVGLAILLWMVLKGRAHAGLPLLNGGAITGYLLGALLSGLTLLEALGVEGLL
jgi:presenilin-like A22 family membrane protease